MELPRRALVQLETQYAEYPKAKLKEIESYRQILRECIETIVQSGNDTAFAVAKKLDDLSTAAYESMQAQTGDAEFHLSSRQTYTDSCILAALLRLICTSDESNEDVWIKCIHALDAALVFSAGPARMDLVHDLIDCIQKIKLHSPPTPIISTPSPPLFDSTVDLPPCGKKVPAINEPDLISFLTVYSKAPFVIPSGISHWSAMNNHPWSSKAYLESVGGRGRLVPVEIGKDYRVDSWSQRMMEWEDFLGKVETGETPLVYLAQYSLLSQFPLLRNDINVPDLVFSSPESDYPGYAPPANEEGIIINAWLGPKGTMSPAHQDPYFNCYAQVVGRKTVWLAPSHLIEEMYPLLSDTRLSNTTSLDVFSADQPQYPLFTSQALPQSMAIILQPGDLLFFPPGWWHAMKSEDKSFSVSFWF